MAKKGGNPQNLKKNLTPEEARNQGRKGGIKSGEVRRKKRDAKNAMRMFLELAATGSSNDNLETLDVPEKDRTNLVALQARMWTLAMQGNIQAYDRIMEIAGYDPKELRAEKESETNIAIRKAESEAKINNLLGNKDMICFSDSDEDETEKTDVLIYMPYNGRKGCPEPRSKNSDEVDTNASEDTETTRRTTD